MSSPDLIVIKRWTTKQYLLLTLAVLLILFLVAVGGYLYGISDGFKLNRVNSELNTIVSSLKKERDDLQRSLVMQKQISQVDKAANLHAGSSMDSQHQQIRELERELNFFRSIMAPEETEKGLQISRFNWQKLDERTYSWQLSLIQAGSQSRAISGVVKASLILLRGNEKVVLKLTNEDKSANFNYRFKYFQHLSGTIEIADNLVPVSINVVADPAINGQETVEKQFPWQSDEEKIANVE